jgi:hypothetical protein
MAGSEEGCGMSRQVVASLEGMRVVVNDGACELHEYNFVTDCWVPKARSQWPMEREEADTWLDGWNAVDRFAAMNQLVAPVAD